MSTTTQNTEAQSIIDPKTGVKVNPDEQKPFDGVFAKNQDKLFTLADKYLDISSKQAYRLAENYGADLGRLFADAKQSVSFGKLKKEDDGRVDVKSAMKVSAIRTNTMVIMMALEAFQDLGRHGIDIRQTKIVLSETLQKYVDGLLEKKKD